MSALRMITISLVFLCLMVNLPQTNADENLWDEFKNMDVFKIRDGSSACPVPVVGQHCPESNALYYFRCCGDLNGNCCIRIQDWLVALMAFFIILAIISAIVNLLRCILC